MASFWLCEFYLNKDRASQKCHILYLGITGTFARLATKIPKNKNIRRDPDAGKA